MQAKLTVIIVQELYSIVVIRINHNPKKDAQTLVLTLNHHYTKPMLCDSYNYDYTERESV